MAKFPSPALVFLTLPLTACLPDVKEDTAACLDAETCNGLDDDCDGLVDENATDAGSWYPDNDGDGYGDPSTATIACEQPTGFVDEDHATGDYADCDDANANANPGHTETWYDGVDADCDGASDYDQDGDGQDSDLYDGEDCDDTDEDIHVDASEVWYDGVDQNCDGASDYDQDEDGYDAQEHGGQDCDDTNAAYNPGATEVWYDGYDQDCSGTSDYDQDGDGHDADVYGGDDCDDEDDDISPSETETYYDDVDSDCSGTSDFDADGDGYDHEAFGGDDCDDTDAATNPGALDWVDGDDDNCDETIDVQPVTSANVVLAGEAPADEAGTSVSAAGDVNADGYADILVGAYESDAGGTSSGAAYLLLGPVTAADLGDYDARFTGIESASLAGYSITGGGRLNKDGYDDVVVGSPWEGTASSDSYTGAVYVMHGPVTGDMSLEDADVRLISESYDDAAGWALSGGMDTNSDGYDDLLIGASDESSEAYGAGAAYLVLGPVTDSASLATADGKMAGLQDTAYTGSAVALIEDTNGDGNADLLIGAPSYDDLNSNDGAAYLFLGPTTGSLDVGQAESVLAGWHEDDRAGDCVASAGDSNGDGYGDFLVAAPGSMALDSADEGVIYLMLGPADSGESNLMTKAAVKFVGPEDDSGTCAAADVGDVNADGDTDLLFGAYLHDDVGVNSGSAFVISAPFGGTMTIEDADLLFAAEDAGDRLGLSVAGVGDTDADGHNDLLLGAPFNDTTGSNGGAAYLFLGSP